MNTCFVPTARGWAVWGLMWLVWQNLKYWETLGHARLCEVARTDHSKRGLGALSILYIYIAQNSRIIAFKPWSTKQTTKHTLLCLSCFTHWVTLFMNVWIMSVNNIHAWRNVFNNLEIVWWQTCLWKKWGGSWSCVGPLQCWHENGQWRWALCPGGRLSGSLWCACRAQDWYWSAHRTQATPEEWRGKTSTTVSNCRGSINCVIATVKDQSGCTTQPKEF